MQSCKIFVRTYQAQTKYFLFYCKYFKIRKKSVATFLTYWPKKNRPQAKEKLKLKCQVLQYPQVKLRCTPKTLNFYCPTKGDICIKNK